MEHGGVVERVESGQVGLNGTLGVRLTLKVGNAFLQIRKGRIVSNSCASGEEFVVRLIKLIPFQRGDSPSDGFLNFVEHCLPLGLSFQFLSEGLFGELTPLLLV